MAGGRRLGKHEARQLGVSPGSPAWERAVEALGAFLALQKGGAALLTSKKLRRLGYELSSLELAALERVLSYGFRDPLGRGVWRVAHVVKSSPKRYYLELCKEDPGAPSTCPI